MTWFVLRVRSQSEFKVRDELTTAYDVPAMVPRTLALGRTKRGTKSIRRTALIKGYVFAEDVIPHWQRIRQVTGMISLWGDDDGRRPMILTQVEVDAMDALSKLEDAPRSKYTAGQNLRIKRGAYADLAALFKRLERGKVVIEFEMFGKAFEQRVDEAMVEAA